MILGRRLLLPLCVVFLLGAGLPAGAASESLNSQVIEFLQTQPQWQGQALRLQWPGKAPDLPTCPQTMGFRLLGSDKPGGWLLLRVQCPAAGGWVHNVQFRVSRTLQYVSAARNLMPGHVLVADDLVLAEGDSARLVGQVAQNLDAVLGQELRRPIAQGSPVPLNSLRPLTVIRQGNKISLTIKGPGFEIETEGQAMDNAPIGGAVRVLVRENTVIPATVIAPGVAQAQ